ncbi:MAG: patatin-like phospholipase family protein, partial [Bacteroidota bacterium]
MKIGSLVTPGLEGALNVEMKLKWVTPAFVLLGLILVLPACVGTVKHSEKAPDFITWRAEDSPKDASQKVWGLSVKPNTETQNNQGRILTLSGGGFKAGLFHLGSLRALNEAGKLQEIDAFSSVSGGSITTAWLGANWKHLDFDDQGRAANFDSVIYEPLFSFFTEETVDAPSIAMGFLPFVRASESLANRLDARLFKGLSLGDFPDLSAEKTPQFIITATDLRTNTAWYFSKEGQSYAENYEIGRSEMDYSLGQVVASSAAFPPFFAPKKLKLSDLKSKGTFLRNLERSSPELASEFTTYTLLGDGGIYDNLGLERAKSYCHVLVSNAGDPFGTSTSYDAGWYSQLRSTIRHMHRQVEQRRKIHFGDMKSLDHINLLVWEIGDHLDEEMQVKYNGLDDERAWKVATFPVRLKRTDKVQA